MFPKVPYKLIQNARMYLIETNNLRLYIRKRLKQKLQPDLQQVNSGTRQSSHLVGGRVGKHDPYQLSI